VEATLHRLLVDFGTILEARSGPIVVLKTDRTSDPQKDPPRGRGRLVGH
jgi:hypothetical protein